MARYHFGINEREFWELCPLEWKAYLAILRLEKEETRNNLKSLMVTIINHGANPPSKPIKVSDIA